MRNILLTSTFLLTPTLHAAILELSTNTGDLCPTSQAIAISEQPDSAELKISLTALPPVETSGTVLSVRRSCTYTFQVNPGDGREVIVSQGEIAGTYSYEKAGRVFISLAERTLAGDDQTLSHSLIGKHKNESGTYNFFDSFEGWADKGLPCGKPFELTLSLNVTARKTNVATPTQSRLDHMNYKIETAPCSVPAR
ncbi:MAG: hypothetical protein EOP09_04640 [Proteobacteria bacterium]|nr:MAG: hypothetical protein EOP09_04640 [Pseudomonadota bacterium]